MNSETAMAGVRTTEHNGIKELFCGIHDPGMGQWRFEHDSKTAIVVFVGETEVKWLRFLKPGFRHCFVIVGGRHGWVFLNPLLHRTELELIDGYDETGAVVLAGFYRRLGYTVLETTPLCPPRRASLPVPHSCVEVVKRVLGLNAFWIWTPWQLYRYLKKYIINENYP